MPSWFLLRIFEDASGRLHGRPVPPRRSPSATQSWPTPTYSIYRAAGTFTGTGTTCPAISAAGYTELTSGITGTTYTDTAVTVGDAYCYYATAVSSEGLSSVPSNIASNDFRPGVPTSLKETKH